MMLFRCCIVDMIEAPLCSLNNVHIVQPHRVGRLSSLLDVILHYFPASFNKAVVLCTKMLCVARRHGLLAGNVG